MMMIVVTFIKYEPKVDADIDYKNVGVLLRDLSPFKRVDLHEDGTKTTYYGLEMTEKEYQVLLFLLEHGVDDDMQTMQ